MSLGSEFKELRNTYTSLSNNADWGKQDIHDLAEPNQVYLAERQSSKTLDDEQRKIKSDKRKKKQDT